jgi:AcrR family transcriptional regulator
MKRDPVETRQRIIAAADELFYSEGVRSVAVDAIAERAGITKRTLYYHFRSKDDLMAAYLEARDEPTLNRYMKYLEGVQGTLAERILCLFERIGLLAHDAKWKGCSFVRVVAELAGEPGHPALKVGARHKKKFERWLADEIAAEGLGEPILRARQLMILLDGTVTEMLVHRDPSYAEAAGRIAAVLLTKGSGSTAGTTTSPLAATPGGIAA